MKKLLVIAALVSIAGLAHGQRKIDIEKEKEAILKVCIEEAAAFDARDYDRLVKTFVDFGTSVRIESSKEKYIYGEVFEGWKEKPNGYRTYFENNPNPQTRDRKITNARFNVYEECAWVTYFETQNTGREEIKLVILEKEEGEWKIICLSNVIVSSYKDKTE